MFGGLSQETGKVQQEFWEWMKSDILSEDALLIHTLSIYS